ncbi:MAG: flagellar assembly protein T N-terminal domain-containing protein [Myxococcota bacterium]
MRSLALSLILAAAPSGAAFADDLQTIEVEGQAAVQNNDIPQARDRAIDDAKRKAVERVGGASVYAESVTQNFQLVEDRVYSRASGFVKNYEIKTEYKDQDTYVVKLKATVDSKAVAENIGQLFAVKPRVIVLIAEQNVGGGGFSYWWGTQGFSSEMDLMQTQLISQWQPHGFKFVDPGAMRGKIKVSKAMQRADLDNGSAKLVAKDADADIAIVGKVVVTDAGSVMEGTKMRSFHAVGNLRVLNVDTGEILAVADDSAVAPHIDGNVGGRNAIKALADKLSPTLEKAIMAKWTTEAANAQTIEVVLKGAKSKQSGDDLKAMIQSSVRGVERVDVRRKKGDTTYLDVRIKGSTQDLSSALDNKKLGDLTLDVEEMTKAKVVLTLKGS